jgi:sugar lactone lactonase YvrE
VTGVNPTPDRHLLGPFSPWIVAVVLVALALSGFALWRMLDREKTDADLYDIERYRSIPPEKIGYRQVATFDPGLAEPTALAVGPGGEIAVGGDWRVVLLSPDGSRRGTVSVPELPRALAYGPEGELWIGLSRDVLRRASDGKLSWRISLPSLRARITSLAIDRQAVYTADAGARIVWKHAHDGRLLGRIGERGLETDVACFNVPSPYFDLLLAPDGLLRVVDPGRHRIMAFTPEGDLEISWGDRSFELEGFSGCCNPSHLAVLADGRFVTSEKGIPRIKVYDVDGTFLTAVVGADSLATEYEPCDVATDGAGRILALDPGARIVRVFEPLRRTPRDD